jgi:hypothetical protein
VPFVVTGSKENMDDLDDFDQLIKVTSPEEFKAQLLLKGEVA